MQLLSPIYNSVSHISPQSIFESALYPHASESLSPEECINHSLYLEAEMFLHGLLLLKTRFQCHTL